MRCKIVKCWITVELWKVCCSDHRVINQIYMHACTPVLTGKDRRTRPVPVRPLVLNIVKLKFTGFRPFFLDFSVPGPRVYMKIGRVIDFYMGKTLINLIFQFKQDKIAKMAKNPNIWTIDFKNKPLCIWREIFNIYKSCEFQLFRYRGIYKYPPPPVVCLLLLSKSETFPWSTKTKRSELKPSP